MNEIQASNAEKDQREKIPCLKVLIFVMRV